MKQFFRYQALFALIALLIAMQACNDEDQNNKPGEKTLRIGVILPLTGRLAQMGEVEKNAMLLAQDDINTGSKKIELLFEDGKGTPNEAVTSAQKLINIDKVDLVLTSTTGASLAVEPITTAKKINLVSFCMDPDVAKKSGYVIRYYQGINEEAKGILQYFDNTGQKGKVAILYGKVPVWEKAINDIYEPYFKNNGIDLAYRESYDLAEKDFRNLVLKLKNSGADRLILLGYGFEYGNIFNALAETGLAGKIKIVGGWGFLYTGLSKEQLEGVVVSGPDYVFNTAGDSAAPINKYKARHGTEPNFDAAFAYEAITGIAKQVIVDSLNSPFKSLFKNSGVIEGVVGKYSFNEHGEMITHFGLGIYKNGQIVKY